MSDAASGIRAQRSLPDRCACFGPMRTETSCDIASISLAERLFCRAFRRAYGAYWCGFGFRL